MDDIAQKRATKVAWSMLFVYTVGLGVGLALESAAGEVSLLPPFTAFMVVGAVIVARRPRNSIGWVFSAIGLLASTGVLAMSYADYALTTRGVLLRGVVLAAWYSAWFWYPLISLPFFALLLFPTGRLPSSLWRPVAGLMATTIAIVTGLSALQPTVGVGVTVPNPIGVSGVPAPESGALGTVLLATFMACGGAAALSLVLRFRRSHGVERQQLKWVTYAGALLATCFVLDELVAGSAVLSVLSDVALGLIPVAAGIAILRYRLYDIDRLIRRTVSYSLLTVLLGTVYVSVVLVSGRVFGEIGGRPPSWVIAGATLAVAGLFQPARRRLQAIVDRRFNRTRYDAIQALEAFAGLLRDELDPEAISEQLLATVGRTIEPSAASLWLPTATTTRT